MSYSYEIERPHTLTDEGQRRCFQIHRAARNAFKVAGSVRADRLLNAAGSGDSFKMMACIDRLVEIGELQEVTTSDPHRPWQWRIFIAGRASDDTL